ncbi:MAG: universal stress protein [Myxococcota bacterium]
MASADAEGEPKGPGAGVKTILIATDFSETAEAAVARGCALAKHRGARVVLTHAMGLAPYAVGGPPPVAAIPQDLEQAVREAAERRLDLIAEQCEKDGVAAQTEVDTGEPARCIIDLAERSGADLIVIGTRGLSGLKHLVLGSTAEAVVRGAACPVLTVHQDDHGKLDPPATLLVAGDFSSESAHAAHVGADLFASAPGQPKVKALLLHVHHWPMLVEPLLGDIEMVPVDFDEIVEPLTEDLAPAAERLREEGFEVECRVREGDPSAVIIELAQREGVDAIVMGTHGHSGLKHLLLGSTAQRVVQHAPCAVLTVRKE